MFIVLFFFCKQKTAYEMRISDWSSDVCSSDLGAKQPPAVRRVHPCAIGIVHLSAARFQPGQHFVDHRKLPAFIHLKPHFRRVDHGGHCAPQFRHALLQRRGGADETNGGVDCIVKTVILVFERSEEHTSELQSLMRISYAVCCMKKK